MSDLSGKTMLWVHDEMLRPGVLRPGEPACFVFDEQWVRDAGISLKRLVFIAECLEQMPGVEVRRGDVIEELSDFAEEHAVTTIRTQVTPLPRLRSQIDRLGERFELEFFHEPAFVVLPGRVDLKRFSRYWNKAKKRAFTPTAEQETD
ncbi:MAG: hypothetical protein AAGE65_01280 [Planctomycetota bacterium]